MTAHYRFLKHSITFTLFAAVMTNAHSATTDIAQSPLVTSSSSTQVVRPNVFLMMDDSGSMGWDYMPDNNNSPYFSGRYGYVSNQCNGVYYNPAITYTPPVLANGTSYPSPSFTAAPDDGYGVVSSSSTSLKTSFGSNFTYSGNATGPAYYYTYSGAQTTAALKNYASSSSTFYQECNSSIGSTPGSAVFSLVGVGISSTLKITAVSSAVVTGITVSGQQIMSASTGTSTSSASTLASSIASRINASSAGYKATAQGSSVAIIAPAGTALATPVLAYTGTLTYTLPALTNSGIGNTNETANFANWYSYYRTRINMMKSATGLAFQTMDKNYRVGFATMNNNGGADFLNPAPFVDSTSPTSTQRTQFYTMLYNTQAGSSTPLLEALSNVGLMYAHKLPGNTLNTVAAADPIEYYCQQNFAILSTDGYWNNSNNSTITSNGSGSACSPTAKLNSSTAVGNCDGTEQRPMYDGASSVTTTATPTTTVTTTTTAVNPLNSITWSDDVITLSSSGCNGSKKKVKTQPYSYIQTPAPASSVTTTSTSTTNSTSTVTCTNGLCGAPVVTNSTTTTNTSTSPSFTAPSQSLFSASGSSTTSGCTSNPPVPGTSTPVPTFNGTSSQGTSTSTTTGTPVVTNSSGGGTSNTLSDVAEYYYITDLRDSSLGNNIGALGNDVSANKVPSSGLDGASWQHMTTFTLGLGARGDMVFSPKYQTDSSGDYYSVANGVAATTGVCSWQSSGACNWPTPDPNGGPTNVDDLWHAAVNGRGTYYSATDPATLSAGISSALAGVTARTGSSASASISNPNISTGDNFIFSSSFVSQYWYGHLVRQQLDLTTGALSPTIDWDAETLLDNNLARKIYAYSPGTGFVAFNATNFGSNTNFSQTHIGSLSQFCTTGTACLSPANQTAASGAALVNFLAGDRSNEGFPTITTAYYNSRSHLLGDIVDSQAAYVKAPPFLYSDSGYSSFVAANTNRQSMIYVGANDGMLHAFYANTDMMDSTGNVVTSGGTSVTGGAEAWAFIPTAVMPNLYKLADIKYATNHQYYVDGSPLVTDICPTAPATSCTATTWKTILFGGLNAGGNSYFAIDVTNPASPQALWEFTDPNLGYSFGNPEAVKLGGAIGSTPAGTWVILLSSGYNNADGMGHLFVLNAYTGVKILDISTGIGSAGSPSGLSQITAQVANPSLDATLQQVYGGDLLGNLWRFDVNGNVGAPGNDAQLLAVLKGPNGLPQPITAKLEVGLVNGHVVVFVGTGRYLGGSDLSDSTQASPNLQSVYAIMDPLLTTTTPSVAIYNSPRTVTTNPFVQQTEFNTTCPMGAPSTICTVGQIIRTSSSNPVSIPSNSGWYLDLPDSGERINTNLALELGMLAFNSNVPSSSACSTGGDSYNYLLDYTSGAALSNSIITISAALAATLPSGMYTVNNGVYTMSVAAVQHTGSLSTAPIFIKLPNGSTAICTNDSTGLLTCRSINAPPPPGGARRVSWRQLLSQ